MSLVNQLNISLTQLIIIIILKFDQFQVYKYGIVSKRVCIQAINKEIESLKEKLVM